MKNGKLRVLEGGRVAFYCSGCKEYHTIHVGRTEHPVWNFNGNYEKPTFSPSVLIRSGHYVPGYENDCWCKYNTEHPDKPAPFKCSRCHSFVTDGKIQYLSDCTHELAGQTVELQNAED
jgi:hypothetical protein